MRLIFAVRGGRLTPHSHLLFPPHPGHMTRNPLTRVHAIPNTQSIVMNETWFCGEMNRQLQEKFNMDKDFTCDFTDSWSQTPGPPGFNTEDPLQQEHWKSETTILWEMTTSREDSFSFMTIDDILEENTRLKLENQWLNDVISSNITHLT